MPNRVVREGILTSDRVDRIADEPATEVFYRRLHSVADDYGRYFAHPSLLRAALYPLRLEKTSDAEVSRHVEACAVVGLIRLYRVDGKPFLELVGFNQRTRAMKSKFPAPEGQTDAVGQAGAWHPAIVCPSDGSQMTAACPSPVSRPQAYSETETETETRADGAIPLDAFFEERYTRHPKKRDRVLAEHAMSEIHGIESREVQDKFRHGHEAWLATDDYQWKGGAKCPSFAAFITDRTWQYPPPEAVRADTGPVYRKWTPPTATEEKPTKYFDPKTITG